MNEELHLHSKYQHRLNVRFRCLLYKEWLQDDSYDTSLLTLCVGGPFVLGDKWHDHC